MDPASARKQLCTVFVYATTALIFTLKNVWNGVFFCWCSL